MARIRASNARSQMSWIVSSIGRTGTVVLLVIVPASVHAGNPFAGAIGGSPGALDRDGTLGDANGAPNCPRAASIGTDPATPPGQALVLRTGGTCVGRGGSCQNRPTWW